MKKLRTILTGLTASAALAVSMTSIGASAVDYGFYQTPALTTGQWIKTPTTSITGTNENIYAGDFGVWWFENGVGMNTKFVRSTARKVNIKLYEADANGTDIQTKCQTAYFSVQNGIYRPTGYTGETVVYNNVVENDNVAEVYMKLNVDYITGDTTKNIPVNLMLYRYWID
jgi:hypothetical protein